MPGDIQVRWRLEVVLLLDVTSKVRLDKEFRAAQAILCYIMLAPARPKSELPECIIMDRTANAIRVTTILIFCGTIYGQSDAPLKFEVASIKPSRAEDRSERASDNPAIFDMNTTARSLVLNAYQLQDYQLLGEPKWLNTDYYRIVAKPPAGPVPADQHTRSSQMSERLRSLLAERFQSSWWRRAARNCRKFRTMPPASNWRRGRERSRLAAELKWNCLPVCWLAYFSPRLSTRPG
jgi:hypothetical protein